MSDKYLDTLARKRTQSRQAIAAFDTAIANATAGREAEMCKLGEYDIAERIYKDCQTYFIAPDISNDSTRKETGASPVNNKRRPSGSVKRIVLTTVANARPRLLTSAAITTNSGEDNDSIRPAVKDSKESGDLYYEIIDGVYHYGITPKGLLYLEHQEQKEKQQNTQDQQVGNAA